MAVNFRKPSAHGVTKPFNKRKIRRTPTSKHSSASQQLRLAANKKRTVVSRPRRPGVLRNRATSEYNPTRLAITDLNIPPENRRMVLCDAENIAYNDLTGEFYTIRIYEAYHWFVSNGYETMVLFPDYLFRKLIGPLPNMNMQVINDISDGAQNPSTNVPFELELLQRANDTEAAIVSERSFSSTYYDFEEVVKERVIGYTFFRDSIFIPVDPYGRAGPWLRVILHK